jgi:uncharacterized protein YjbI with pentapeptide repeats
MRDDDKPDILKRFRLRKLLNQVKGLRLPKRPDWLRRAQDRTGLSAVPPTLFLILATTWAVVALTLFIGFYAVLWQTIFRDAPEGQEAVWDWRFSIAQLVAVTTVAGAVIALPITLNRLVLTRRQTEAAENDHANSVQGQITDRINTAVQGLGAQKEVNQIGRPVFLREPDPNHAAMDGTDSEERHTKIEWRDTPLQLPDGMYPAEQGKWQVFTQTKPNLEVRIGAIYALERIAQDSDRDHVQIMEILCAYIRQNAPAPAEDYWPELEMKDSEDEGPLEADWVDRLNAFRKAQEEAKAKLSIREDIQTALTVIGRRSTKQRRLEAGRGVEAPVPFDIPCPDYDGPKENHDYAALHVYRVNLNTWLAALKCFEGYRLDLRGANLRGADLSDADLNGALVIGTYLQGADLSRARLQGSDLMDARLQGADLGLAQLQGAFLRTAQLQGADLGLALLQVAFLGKARLQGAVLWHARLQGARLMDARLQGADLGEASLQGAHLRQSRLQGANLAMAQLQGANLTRARLDKNTGVIKTSFGGSAVKSVDFEMVPQIAAHVQDMFGDASVTLPGGHGPEHEDWPAHWSKFKLRRNFEKRWRKWQANPYAYPPPDPPEKTA